MLFDSEMGLHVAKNPTSSGNPESHATNDSSSKHTTGGEPWWLRFHYDRDDRGGFWSPQRCNDWQRRYWLLSMLGTHNSNFPEFSVTMVGSISITQWMSCHGCTAVIETYQLWNQSVSTRLKSIKSNTTCKSDVNQMWVYPPPVACIMFVIGTTGCPVRSQRTAPT